jgi:hypothetical protein
MSPRCIRDAGPLTGRLTIPIAALSSPDFVSSFGYEKRSADSEAEAVESPTYVAGV